MNPIHLLSNEELVKLVRESHSKREVLRLLLLPVNGGSIVTLNERLIKDNIDTSHFVNTGAAKNRKYQQIKKVCPVCGNTFVTQEGHKKEKVTCSHSCSNTYFRKGSVYNTSQLKSYITICFKHHEKKCVVCGEDKIVAVHHYDGNNTNNEPNNLIPLCPTHHSYWHSRYRGEIQEIVEKYKQSFGE